MPPVRGPCDRPVNIGNFITLYGGPRDYAGSSTCGLNRAILALGNLSRGGLGKVRTTLGGGA